MKRFITLTMAIVSIIVIFKANPVLAVTNGAPDGDGHPYVGELLFYVPDAVDPRFTEPGAWFSCSGTLIDTAFVITAGHCTFGIGLKGESTTDGGTITLASEGGSGGDDIWINFATAPDFSGLPRSVDYIPDRNGQRYTDRANWLNDCTNKFIHGKAYPHPGYNDNAFFLHDLGVVKLDTTCSDNFPQVSTVGLLPQIDILDAFKTKKGLQDRSFTAVGYGLQRSGPATANKDEGGDIRYVAFPNLIQVDVKGYVGDFAILLTNNAKTGGTCFGDSGGPNFIGSYSGANTLAGVTSFGKNVNCGGTGGVYRVDKCDDQCWLNTFNNGVDTSFNVPGVDICNCSP